MAATIVLSLNSGSSSLKFGWFEAADSEVRAIFSGAVEGIGGPNGHFWVRRADGSLFHEDRSPVPQQEDALRIVARLVSDGRLPQPSAIGHRVVHGGPQLREHQRVTPYVIGELEKAAVFAPLHVPVELRLIRLTETHFPSVPQFACFDTAFHRTIGEAAARFALPEDFWEEGVRRYGFHGLSCESILHTLGKEAPAKIIIAHLGNGASVTAIENGASVDTTMGLTPTGGIVMGTRPGDLDPGIFLYIMRNARVGVDELESLLNRKSGLLGISGISSDMRQLHGATNDPRAKMAVEIFCRAVKKVIGSYFAILGGLNLLVFSGGIGENDPIVRSAICGGLEAFGIEIDEESNQKNQPSIGTRRAQVGVRVVHSDEEIQIARQTAKLLA
ncbi:MAG TPA: acetate/propionate family kinase [Candidatus Micrarchaeaceae archaeon]|nr:acetate/propionate family kinase [Candidatus Micrarchaeaceae archaeon]